MSRSLSVLVLFGSLAACDYRITEGDRCDGLAGVGELSVVIRPAYGFAGWGEIVFVGDTLPLVASVQPVVGASVDIWGGGGCKTDYGDPVPADIEWSSADVKIATVSSNGVVRATSEGSVRITATDRTRGLSGGVEVAVWVRAGGG